MKFLLYILLFLFGCSNVKLISTPEHLILDENAVYFCMGQKNCFSCICKFDFLKDSIKTNDKRSKLFLLLETNNDHKLIVNEQIRKIEKELNFKFDGYVIDLVKFDGPFSNSCGYLCQQKLVHFPALIFSGQQLEFVPFEKLFSTGTELDKGLVLDIIQK